MEQAMSKRPRQNARIRMEMERRDISTQGSDRRLMYITVLRPHL